MVEEQTANFFTEDGAYDGTNLPKMLTLFMKADLCCGQHPFSS
jgi:hypothetical protein